MRNIFYILYFLPIISFGQESYQWNNIESIAFYDLSKQGFDCRIESADQIPEGVKPIYCNAIDWTNALNHLSLYKYDVRAESCYVLLMGFSDNIIIPFQFFPDQKVLIDLRPDKWSNILYFDENFHEYLDDLFRKYIN